MTPSLAWRPRFHEESRLFDPIRAVARLFDDHAAFPSPEEIDEALRDRAGVRFERQSPRARELYDTRIVKDGVVPTRAGSWHDFFNALVWATFPRAKAALHARQYALVVPGAPRRTAEGDALAMVDEGGVLCARTNVVFGHAIYEARVAGRRALGAGLALGEAAGDVDGRAAAVLADPAAIRSPKDLSRVELEGLDEALACAVPSP